MQILEARTGFEPVNDGFADRPLNHLSISPSVFYYITNNLFCQLFYDVFLRKSKRKRATFLSVAHKQKTKSYRKQLSGKPSGRFAPESVPSLTPFQLFRQVHILC